MIRNYKFFLSSLLAAILLWGCGERQFIDDITPKDPGADTEAPTVDIEFPFDGYQIRVLEEIVPIEIRYEVEDDIELQEITISLDGTVLNSITEFRDFRRVDNTFVYEDLGSGEHEVTVTATDLTGKSTSASVSFSKVEPYQPMDGEIFYMAFDGELLDLVTLNEASTSGNVTFADGVENQAISFDSEQNSYALYDSVDAFANLSSFTVSYWSNIEFVDADNNNGIDGIIGMVNFAHTDRFWANMDLFIENGSNPTDGADMRLHFTHTIDEENVSEAWITDVNDVQGIFNTWAHHVITFDEVSGEFAYYINGMQRTTAEAAWDGGINFGSLGSLVMGCVHFQTDPSQTSATDSQPWAGYMEGELDQLRIFNRALSPSEVSDLNTMDQGS